MVILMIFLQITNQIIENLKSIFLQILHLFIHRTSILLQVHTLTKNMKVENVITVGLYI